MKLKVLLAALLLLSAVFVVVADNQLRNENSVPPSETNHVNEPPNEMNSLAPSNQVSNSSVNSPNKTNTTSDTIEVEATEYPFRLTMTLDKTAFKLGEPVNISLFLEYTGNENLTLVFSSGNDQLSFTVYDEKNSSVYKRYSNWVYPQYYVPTVVVPGWYQNITYTWYQEDGLVYQGLEEDPPAYYNKVSAGTYHIVGIFISHTLNLTIETPYVTITIVE